MIGKTILYFVITIVSFLALYFIINAVKNRKKIDKKDKKEIKTMQLADIDRDDIATKLSNAVKIPTVSLTYDGSNKENFVAYHEYLEKTFPEFHKVAQKTVINNYSLIYYIEGEDKSLLPAGFLAHQDVVPAGDNWEVDPFAGEIKDDGYIYGRGTADMKNQMICVLNAIETVLKRGDKLKRSIYCCFGHDEEPGGKEGASNIVKYLKDKGVELEYVVDEGGIFLDGKMFSIDGKIALIGTCEKGYADIKITAKVDGGHASMPSKHTALGELCDAVAKVEKYPTKAKFTQPVNDLFDTLVPHIQGPLKFVLGNRGLFGPVIKKVLMAKGMTAALMHTTMAPTMAQGSKAENVIPNTATANINCRIMPGESIESTRAYIEKIVDNPNVEVKIGDYAVEPSEVSPRDSEAFKNLCETIKDVFPGYVPAPFLFVAGTDAKYYYDICKNVFRFAPFELTDEDRNRIHSKNERCKVDDLVKACQFFVALIEKTCE